MNDVRWIIPEAKEPPPAAAREPAVRTATRITQRLRLGLLDNSKDNARLLLDLIAQRVRQEMDVEIVARRKNAATLGAPEEMLEELAREADCVLTAMAD